MELLAQESTERIKEIWTEYHKLQDCIYAVIPTATYFQMKERALAAYVLERGKE